ncbi:MAG: hypothetical protein WA786_07145 [Acidimicrobiales bacterium]
MTKPVVTVPGAKSGVPDSLVIASWSVKALERMAVTVPDVGDAW